MGAVTPSAAVADSTPPPQQPDGPTSEITVTAAVRAPVSAGVAARSSLAHAPAAAGATPQGWKLGELVKTYFDAKGDFHPSLNIAENRALARYAQILLRVAPRDPFGAAMRGALSGWANNYKGGPPLDALAKDIKLKGWPDGGSHAVAAEFAKEASRFDQVVLQPNGNPVGSAVKASPVAGRSEGSVAVVDLQLAASPLQDSSLLRVESVPLGPDGNPIPILPYDTSRPAPANTGNPAQDLRIALALEGITLPRTEAEVKEEKLKQIDDLLKVCDMVRQHQSASVQVDFDFDTLDMHAKVARDYAAGRSLDDTITDVYETLQGALLAITDAYHSYFAPTDTNGGTALDIALAGGGGAVVAAGTFLASPTGSGSRLSANGVPTYVEYARRQADRIKAGKELEPMPEPAAPAQAHLYLGGIDLLAPTAAQIKAQKFEQAEELAKVYGLVRQKLDELGIQTDNVAQMPSMEEMLARVRSDEEKGGSPYSTLEAVEFQLGAAFDEIGTAYVNLGKPALPFKIPYGSEAPAKWREALALAGTRDTFAALRAEKQGRYPERRVASPANGTEWMDVELPRDIWPKRGGEWRRFERPIFQPGTAEAKAAEDLVAKANKQLPDEVQRVKHLLDAGRAYAGSGWLRDATIDLPRLDSDKLRSLLEKVVVASCARDQHAYEVALYDLHAELVRSADVLKAYVAAAQKVAKTVEQVQQVVGMALVAAEIAAAAVTGGATAAAVPETMIVMGLVQFTIQVTGEMAVADLQGRPMDPYTMPKAALAGIVSAAGGAVFGSAMKALVKVPGSLILEEVLRGMGASVLGGIAMRSVDGVPPALDRAVEIAKQRGIHTFEGLMAIVGEEVARDVLAKAITEGLDPKAILFDAVVGGGVGGVHAGLAQRHEGAAALAAAKRRAASDFQREADKFHTLQLAKGASNWAAESQASVVRLETHLQKMSATADALAALGGEHNLAAAKALREAAKDCSKSLADMKAKAGVPVSEATPANGSPGAGAVVVEHAAADVIPIDDDEPTILTPDDAAAATPAASGPAGPTAASPADLTRPKAIFVLSDDLRGSAERLVLPARYKNATIIMGHGEPGNLAGLDRERVIQFVQAHATAGEPVIFVSCSLGAKGAEIPTAVAGLARQPLVVSFTETLLVLSEPLGNLPRGSLVAIRENPGIKLAIQHGTPPNPPPDGKVVKLLGKDKAGKFYFIVHDQNLMLRRATAPRPGAAAADHYAVRFKVGDQERCFEAYDVLDLSKARRVSLPVIGGSRTQEINLAQQSAQAAAARAVKLRNEARITNKPAYRVAADFNEALGDLYQAKANWYQTSSPDQLQKAKLAFLRLRDRANDFRALMKPGIPRSYKSVLDTMDASVRQSWRWLTGNEPRFFLVTDSTGPAHSGADGRAPGPSISPAPREAAAEIPMAGGANAGGPRRPIGVIAWDIVENFRAMATQIRQARSETAIRIFAGEIGKVRALAKQLARGGDARGAAMMQGAARRGERLLAEVRGETFIDAIKPDVTLAPRSIDDIQRGMMAGFRALQENFAEAIAANQPVQAQGYRTWLVNEIGKVEAAAARVRQSNPALADRLERVVQDGRALLAAMPAQPASQNMSAQPASLNMPARPASPSAAPAVELDPNDLIDDEITQVEAAVELDENDIVLDDNAEGPADANKRIMLAKFNQIALNESMGGNAGALRLAVNGAIDPRTGAIVDLGNHQNFDPEIRARLASGDLKTFTIVYEFGQDLRPKPSPFSLASTTAGLSPAAQGQLAAILAWVNAPEKPLGW